ncbi:hypothetical protein [Haliangium sp.]|uniref:hypothetical protein n=1 Tax=Haliangium sp. TaxID=2663208 RepID=UPI003D13A267
MELQELIQGIERAFVARASYDEIVRLIDEAAAHPQPGDLVALPAYWRHTIAMEYDRPSSECREALVAFLALEPDMERCLWACAAAWSMHPDLADIFEREAGFIAAMPPCRLRDAAMTTVAEIRARGLRQH